VTALEYLTVQDIVTELNVSKMTVYRLIHEQELRATRIRQQYRIRRDDLNRYLRNAEIRG
jgi:excisionase family DNA binding protein